MKKRMQLGLLALSLLPGTVLAGEPAAASGQAAHHASQAMTHSARAVFSGMIATGQVASAASAVPLRISATAGMVSGQSADALMAAATAPIGTPLPVAEETYSAGPPPDEALKPAKQPGQ